MSPNATVCCMGDCDRARGPFFAPRNVVAPVVMSRTSCESSEHVEPALDAKTDDEGLGGRDASRAGSDEQEYRAGEPHTDYSSERACRFS